MISIQEIYAAFAGSFSLNSRIMREICGVRFVELVPKPGTLLHLPSAPGTTCRIPFDTVIAPDVILKHAWEGDLIVRLRALIEGRVRAATLVDIGGHTGLFTRQMMAIAPQLRGAFVYEPHPENYRCLRHNLAPLKKVRTGNYALGREAGTLDFFLDPDNSGNYSLTRSAMPAGRDCETISVAVRAAETEARAWLTAGLPIFYKSDTQGY